MRKYPSSISHRDLNLDLSITSLLPYLWPPTQEAQVCKDSEAEATGETGFPKREVKLKRVPSKITKKHILEESFSF